MNLEGKVLNQTDSIYHHLILDAIDNGAIKGDRTGTGTRALVGRLARFDLMNGRNPRVTTKFVNENPEKELKWFMNGSSSIKELRDQKIGIWNSWLMPGSAKYRPMTDDEIKAAITRQLLKNDDVETVSFYPYPAEDEVEDAAEAYSNEWQILNKTVIINYAGPEALEGYYIKLFDRRPVFLEDGDIGKGGYGPQWRHWQDTQIISAGEIQSYVEQGYERKGVIDPVVDIEGEDAIKAALEAHYVDQGYKSVSIGTADPIMVPASGFEIVGDKEHGVHVLYRDLESLTKAYMVAIDAPRLVVHREIDQLANAVELLRTNPDSRRIIVSAWNPALTWKAALPPCHLYFQFVSHELSLHQRIKIYNDRTEMLKREHKVKNEQSLVEWHTLDLGDWNRKLLLADDEGLEKLHVELDNLGVKRRGLFGFVLLRSNDLGLGWPFNVAQYATLTHLMAHVTDHEPMELIWTAVDAHVYSNHVDALKKQLERESKEGVPRIKLAKHIKEIDDFKVSDIEIIDYNYHPALTSEMPPAV